MRLRFLNWFEGPVIAGRWYASTRTGITLVAWAWKNRFRYGILIGENPRELGREIYWNEEDTLDRAQEAAEKYYFMTILNELVDIDKGV